jgi:glutamine synthetase
VTAFEADAVLAEAFGAPLAITLMDVRKGEMAVFDGASPAEIAAAMRWIH